MAKIQGFARVGICKILHSMHTLLTRDNLPFIIIRVINVHIFILIRLPPSDNLLSPLGVICLHLQKMQCKKSPTIRLKELQDDSKGWRKGFFIRVPTLVCVSSFPLLLLPLVIILFGETSLPLQCGRELNQKTKTTSTISQSHQINMTSKKKNWWNFATWWQKKGPCNKYKGFFGKRKIGLLSWQGEKTWSC